ncbi:hypothetical protein PPACK8108_LOCUS4096 [Phakopsora pachyrhizi]|uniref:Uncharacterized protein n=1 Tax=Phakopsora pachyrhizi TaxID=170000 RepID=A0AAV0AP01_PHAPC|nr:hypothetical protein PPACK8108_LOCUS4096 [Phakopsora pachyrhizi]
MRAMDQGHGHYQEYGLSSWSSTGKVDGNVNEEYYTLEKLKARISVISGPTQVSFQQDQGDYCLGIPNEQVTTQSLQAYQIADYDSYIPSQYVDALQPMVKLPQSSNNINGWWQSTKNRLVVETDGGIGEVERGSSRLERDVVMEFETWTRWTKWE